VSERCFYCDNACVLYKDVLSEPVPCVCTYSQEVHEAFSIAFIHRIENEYDRVANHLSPRQVGDKVGISEDTVRNWCHGGQLPSNRVGLCFYIDPSALDVAHKLAEPILRKRTQGKAARLRNTI